APAAAAHAPARRRLARSLERRQAVDPERITQEGHLASREDGAELRRAGRRAVAQPREQLALAGLAQLEDRARECRSDAGDAPKAPGIERRDILRQGFDGAGSPLVGPRLEAALVTQLQERRDLSERSCDLGVVHTALRARAVRAGTGRGLTALRARSVEHARHTPRDRASFARQADRRASSLSMALCLLVQWSEGAYLEEPWEVTVVEEV